MRDKSKKESCLSIHIAAGGKLEDFDWANAYVNWDERSNKKIVSYDDEYDVCNGGIALINLTFDDGETVRFHLSRVTVKVVIKPLSIPVQTVEFFDPWDQSLGFLNATEFANFKCQIAEANASGYYLMFEGEKINIMPNSELQSWPKGLYDLEQSLYVKLIKIRRAQSLKQS